MANEITTRTSNSVPSLVDVRRDFATYPRLESYKDTDAIAAISGIVLMAYQFRGQAANPEDLNFIATNLYSELMADEHKVGTKYITFYEMTKIVKAAVLGKAEMYGISVASLYKVIREYCEGPGAEASRRAREINRKEARQNEPKALQAFRDVAAMKILQTIKDRNK